MKLKLYILLIFSFITTTVAYPQDPQLTQFFSSPLYLAPSFAGTGLGSRAVLNFRDQWLAIPGAFVTYMFSLDHNFYRYRSGVGLLFLRDQAGSGHLATTQVSLNYSYNIVINRMINIRPAMAVVFAQRSIDYSRLLFNDQLSFEYGVTPTVESRLIEKRQYIDFVYSTVVFTRRYWGGVNIAHLLQPDQSLLNEGLSPVPTELTVFGGGKWKRGSSLFRKESILFSPDFPGHISRSAKKAKRFLLGD